MITAQTLALYLGCECTEAGLSSRGNTLVEVAFDGYETSSVRTPQGSILNIKTENIKPILRPLSSMTEEEAVGLVKFDSIRHDEIEIMEIEKDKVWYIDGERWSGDGVSEVMDKNIYFNQLQAEQFQYLLSKHFDLFGLIEKNEAIDITKL